MNCILIDDEPDCLGLLALMIEKYCPDLTIVGQFNDPKMGIEAIWETKPDLVFLDVDMPNINGFGVLDACKGVHFQVIFTTAYQEYAVRAFRYSATSYLLKPLDRVELVEAAQRAKQLLSAQQIAEQREVLFNYMDQAGARREKIGLTTAEGIVFLPIADIEYCEADGNYTNIFLSGKERPLVFVKALKDIEDLLAGGTFFRPHHSYIVNLRKVDKYIRGEGGELRMENGHNVPVSRPNKKDVMSRLGVK